MKLVKNSKSKTCSVQERSANGSNKSYVDYKHQTCLGSSA